MARAVLTVIFEELCAISSSAAKFDSMSPLKTPKRSRRTLIDLWSSPRSRRTLSASSFVRRTGKPSATGGVNRNR